MVPETIWFSRVWYHRGLRYLHNSVLNPRLSHKGPRVHRLCHWYTKTSFSLFKNFRTLIGTIWFWKLEYWSPWRDRQFSWKSSSFVPGVVKWIKYTFCTGKVLLLPLPGNTGYSEVCKHFEFGVVPQIARFRRLRALWTDWITGFTCHNWT